MNKKATASTTAAGGVSIDSDTTAAVVAYRRDPARAEFFGFVRGNTVFSFDLDGLVISRKLVWPEEPAAVAVQRKQFALPIMMDGHSSLTLSLNEAGFPILPVGLTIVSGGTGVGKSTFLKALGRQMDLRRLLAVEPHDTGAEVAQLPTFSSVDGALVAAIGNSYMTPEALFAVDSLRAPLFETTGAAGAKGVIMPFFTQLTRVSNCLAMAGISVVATVNPMNNDPEYVAEFMSKLSASVPATILLDTMRREGGVEKFTGTMQMRPNRAKINFSFESGQRKIITNEHLLSDIEFEPVAATSPSFTAVLINNAIDKAL